MASYKPIVMSVEMSRYGYWIVTLSVAPGLRMQVMLCQVGITPDRAAADALATLSGMRTHGRVTR